MGISCTSYLSGGQVWCCVYCRTHLTTDDSLMSEDFKGKHGRAKLFSDVTNITRLGTKCSEMTTGVFEIQEIVCKHCHKYVGWTYVRAYSKTEAYKEGKFILESPTITTYNNRSML